MNILILGAGLYGCTLGYLLKEKGHNITIFEKRNHIGGNLYCEKDEETGIYIHKYGPHIFHTNDKKVWDFLNQFITFNNFINQPIANYKDELYNLPFNMNTFIRIFPTCKTPEDVKKVIEKEKKGLILDTPKNLAEQAISFVGTTIFNKLIKGYTEKQWGKKCEDLSPDIIKRIPLRFTFDNNYFNALYQGIPINGYNSLFEKLTQGIDVFLSYKEINCLDLDFSKYDKVICSGPIDKFFNYKFGKLEWRSLKFLTEKYPMEKTQGCAVMNFTSTDVGFTRVYEHAYFNQDERKWKEGDKTIVTFEFPERYNEKNEPYYSINNQKNISLYKKYIKYSEETYGNKLLFGGRLGDYAYYDMDKTILKAFEMCDKINKTY